MYQYSTPPGYIPPSDEAVTRAIEKHMPGRRVQSIQDRGVWMRHIFMATLDNGESVFFKIKCRDWGNDKEVFVSQLLLDNGLPAPRTFAYDDTNEIISYPFIIQEKLGGTRLGDLLDRVNKSETLRIYAAMGRFYRQLHAITHERSGWIIDGTGCVGDTAPNDYMVQQVIVTIGREAVERGHLSETAHRRLIALWQANSDELKDHKPALVGVHCYWTVALDKIDNDWQVVRLTDLGDFLYWDRAAELALIKYPVFRLPLAARQWDAFVSEYGDVPDDRRIRLYHLMQRLDAAMGNYLAPKTDENAAWMRAAWTDFDSLMDAIEAKS